MLDLLFPPLCISCRTRIAEPHRLCPTCWNTIAFLDGAMCTRCGLPFEVEVGVPGEEGEVLCGACHAQAHDVDRARALMRYDDASKDLILAFKRGDRLDYAPAFAVWLDRVGRPLLAEADAIVPVPLHRFRLWRRRYNQAAVLGLRLSALSGKPHLPDALMRSRPTPSQSTMPSAKARRRNVLGAFKVPHHKISEIKGKSILLVDDVFTTGATLDACARALKRAGAKRVDALTLARVVRASAV